jgi:hypothetical protein
MIAVWDDHEVVDNQGPGIPLGPAYGDAAIDALLAAGRRAFWEHTPWRQPLEGPFWRALPMGRHVEILALDGRSHRTPVLGDASPADRWLGAAQAAWLADRLAHPTTTWQIVLLSQPIGAVIHHDWRARTGSDGVADGTAASGGREDELRAALAASPDLSRVLVLAADVHCPGWYRYDLPNGPLHELVTGALFALNLPPPTRDPTFPGEVLWERRLTAPQPPLPEWQSYAIVDVDAEGALSARWMTGDGRTEFTARLPTPT